LNKMIGRRTDNSLAQVLGEMSSDLDSAESSNHRE